MNPTQVAVPQDVEESIAKDLEGGLFAHIYMTNFGGQHFVSRDLYTVINGQVFDVTQKKGLYFTDDTCFELNKCSKRIGKYDPSKTYTRTTNSFMYSEMKKLLKL